MTKTFTSFPNRLDSRFVGFKSDDMADLLHEICCNSTTGAVMDRGTYATVPAHAAEKVAQHLVNHGWTRAA